MSDHIYFVAIHCRLHCWSSGSHSEGVKDATGKSWLTSSKIARKAGHTQTAYSAILQAQRCNTPYSFVENAKLVRTREDPLRALQELEKAMRLSGFLPRERSQGQDAVIDLTVGSEEMRMRAKACSIITNRKSCSVYNLHRSTCYELATWTIRTDLRIPGFAKSSAEQPRCGQSMRSVRIA